MSALEPSVALSMCETALRELMVHAYGAAYGEAWLSKVASSEQIESWAQRAADESSARAPKGVLAVANTGLAYSNFYDLLTIAEKHWEPLSGALGKKAAALALLKRLDNLRNSVAHSRPLLPFEQDLLSGIAGQIRNQVTIFMSAQDPAGDIYPRIESVTDQFGRRIESSTVDGEMAGSAPGHDVVLRPGDSVTFNCVGIDPQGRGLQWRLDSSGGGPSVTPRGRSQEVTKLIWHVTNQDVNETATVQIFLSTADGKYHRYGWFDHRCWFGFRVRPPLEPESGDRDG